LLVNGQLDESFDCGTTPNYEPTFEGQSAHPESGSGK
jgi:hypothetical protein